jgi:hypothetical protein
MAFVFAYLINQVVEQGNPISIVLFRMGHLDRLCQKGPSLFRFINLSKGQAFFQ